MSGNKMNPKTKGKDDKSKTNSKTIGQSNEDVDEPDFALLRKPIPTSITGFCQARKIFDLATEELKDLLSKECDLLYECKVCRNLFRSLANFISHKRVYCKEKFNTSVHSHFIKNVSIVSEIMKIKRLEQGYQESLKEFAKPDNNNESEVDDRIPLSKDLTTVIENIAKSKGSNESSTDGTQVALQKIPNSSVAVFQNVESKESKIDEMRVQVKELDNILSRDTAVLQSDGNFKIKSSTTTEPDNVIQISDDEDNDGNILKCKICEMQFSTQKTLKFHMKYKHVESRLVYPCPDCLEIFSTSWSVYRHLFKVHRKTAAQIRRLRESIQAKAFKMNNPPAFYERRKNNMKASLAQKITEEERIDQENQAWMDNIESAGSLPRCGGCGRTFERRAALAAHTHTCQPRTRALARKHDTKRIEIQIRKDYHKGPHTLPLTPATPTPTPNTTQHSDIKPAKEEEPQIPTKPSKEETKLPVEENKEEIETPMDVSEDDKSNDATEAPENTTPIIDIPKLTIRLPFAHQTEKSNQVTFRQKILPEIELAKLSCKRCDIQFNEIQELYDHMAEHLKWMRYACKLCNFKSYSFEKLPEHVKVVHKLKGDKDFYFSTVKALDGSEALELCEPLEVPDASETSPDSGRPSRCSSDSSRLSDDSSSSSTRVEGSRKRKIYQNKNSTKRRKELALKAGEYSKDSDVTLDKNMNAADSFTSSSLKSFEENSSDMDDVVESITKKQSIDTSVASRRPVRRKTKPKNEDFEYDLSNLLKMEAQGYRDALVMQANAKSNQSKKKVQQEIQTNYENLNKDCCGALMAMSKKSVDKAAAHIRTSSSSFFSMKEIRPQNIFLRPMLPRSISRGDKVSPKKDLVPNEDRKECSSPIKETTINKVFIHVPVKNNEPQVNNNETKTNNPADSTSTSENVDKTNSTEKETTTQPPTETSTETTPPKEQNTTKPIEIKKPISIPPIKFRRQSLDVIKNPLINKNISDFTKAGMKTKILVIKPINRNKDGTQAVKTPLKFQTIKLKDPNKNSSEDKVSDQVVVVKVPKVECAIARPVATEISNSEKPIETPPAVVQSDNDKETVIDSNGINEIKSIVPSQTESSIEPKSSDSIDSDIVLAEISKQKDAKNECVASTDRIETIASDSVNNTSA